jgi:hypothetical protein
VSRRVTLPGADELFRATGATRGGESRQPELGQPETASAAPVRVAPVRTTSPARTTSPVRTASPGRSADKASGHPTGHEKHDEKITVYVSPEELLTLERARLDLRGVHGLAVDRGRIVREAVAVVLADLEAKGADSILVRRLRDL